MRCHQCSVRAWHCARRNCQAHRLATKSGKGLVDVLCKYFCRESIMNAKVGEEADHQRSGDLRNTGFSIVR
jgi:hypothetical protein